MPSLPSVPKPINAEETFDRLVSWIKNRADRDNMPGIIVGVSGTDSLVTFLAAYKAFDQLGRPEAVTAVNFVHPGSLEENAQGQIVCAGDVDKDWFAREIIPWLENVASEARYVLDDTIPFSDDNKRWGNIFSRALDDATLNHGMAGKYSLVAGTRNKTESVLGTYTLLSRAPSLQPIEHLYKTQILQICEFLEVPQIAMDKSREVDCDCGRFDVQANHLDEIDALIMVQQGELDAFYLDQIDPAVLSAVREFYVEEREANAFREKVPYRPTPTKIVYAGEDFETALGAVRGQNDALKAVSIVTPKIVIDGDAYKAHALVCEQSDNRSEWLAEAFALMGTKGLEAEKIQDMGRAVFGEDARRIDPGHSAILATLSGRIGQYGFSFPAKRFTTQRFADGPSLIELAGFERHERPTDVRDDSLPKYNPQRDEFGIGYTWVDDDWYVEQRRAYILYSRLSSEAPVSLLIRNSSHFYGRDRLQHAAYVSFAQKDPDELLDLSPAGIGDYARFTPWQDVLRDASDVSMDDKLERVAYALDAMDGVDLKFSQWLRTRDEEVRFRTSFEPLEAMFNDAGGFAHLQAFLKEALIRHVEGEKPGSPFYLAQLDAEQVAPWQPHKICGVDADVIAQLKLAQEGRVIQDDCLRELFKVGGKPRQLVMLSGRYGDFPVRLEV